MDEQCAGDVIIDAVEALQDRPLYIRVRATRVGRVTFALRVLAVACFLCRLMGVGVRLVPDGRLCVPRRRPIADIEAEVEAQFDRNETGAG